MKYLGRPPFFLLFTVKTGFYFSEARQKYSGFNQFMSASMIRVAVIIGVGNDDLGAVFTDNFYYFYLVPARVLKEAIGQTYIFPYR